MTVRSDIDDRLLEEALAWHRALAHDDADWDAYTLWLEADPRHRQAFDEITLTDRTCDDRIDDLRTLRSSEPEPVVEPVAPHSVSRRGWLYGSVAAALVAAIAIPAFWSQQQQDIIYATTRSETRQVALGDGIAVDLAPATRLIVKDGDPTRMELAEGDAYFVVKHDPRRTLSIKAGDYSVSDIGTTFGINLSSDAMTVAVAEGHVSVAPDEGEATRVSAGQQLTARRKQRSAQLTAVQPAEVGSWRQGRLVYNNAPLSVVAADIARYSGKTITVDPAIGNRPFSGVLAIGDGSGLLANLSNLMAITYEEKGDRVRISPAPVR